MRLTSTRSFAVTLIRGMTEAHSILRGNAHNNVHAMERSMAIDHSDVMVSIIGNVLHEVPWCECTDLKFLCYCSTFFIHLYQ